MPCGSSTYGAGHRSHRSMLASGAARHLTQRLYRVAKRLQCGESSMPFDLTFLERNTDSLLPYIGHIAADKVLLKDGSVLVMAELHGRPHELSAADERNAAARTIAGLWKNIAAENLTVCVHLVRRRVDALPPSPVFRNLFSADLDQVYRDKVLRGRLYE